MTQKIGEKLRSKRFETSLTVVVIIACFGLGFFWIVQNNRPDDTPAGRRPAALVNQTSVTPLPETVPQKIPKEYNPGDTLLDLKIDRDREKSRDIETIKQLLEKVGLTDKVRQEAEQELWRLTSAVTKEHELESLLKAKGFLDCLVTIGQQSVTVVVGRKITNDEAKGIGDLMAESAALRLDQIRIVERVKPTP